MASMIVENCYCCGKLLTSNSEKKRRRLLSSPNLSGVLGSLITFSSSFPSVDSSKLHAGYACRNCVGLFQKYEQLQEQISCNLQSAVAILPKNSVPVPCSLASSPELGASSRLASPPAVHEAETMNRSRHTLLTAQHNQSSSTSPALMVSF